MYRQTQKQGYLEKRLADAPAATNPKKPEFENYIYDGLSNYRADDIG